MLEQADMFKKKTELPPKPKMPTINQMVQDVEDAPPEDPAFAGAPPGDENRSDSFAVAQEFMGSTQRLRELELLLLKQQAELQETYKELMAMFQTTIKDTVAFK